MREFFETDFPEDYNDTPIRADKIKRIKRRSASAKKKPPTIVDSFLKNPHKGKKSTSVFLIFFYTIILLFEISIFWIIPVIRNVFINFHPIQNPLCSNLNCIIII